MAPSTFSFFTVSKTKRINKPYLHSERTYELVPKKERKKFNSILVQEGKKEIVYSSSFFYSSSDPCDVPRIFFVRKKSLSTLCILAIHKEQF